MNNQVNDWIVLDFLFESFNGLTSQMKYYIIIFKVILEQPWAEMASAGLMTVVHNDAPPEEMPKRIFLHAMEPDSQST